MLLLVVGGTYGQIIDTVTRLGYVFMNRKIRFVITYIIIEIGGLIAEGVVP